MSPSLPRHLRWNSVSPTARTSSTSRISGSRWAATAKRESHIHAARVALHGSIDEALDFGEGDDFIETSIDSPLSHPEKRTEGNLEVMGQLAEGGTIFPRANATALRDVLNGLTPRARELSLQKPARKLSGDRCFAYETQIPTLLASIDRAL